MDSFQSATTPDLEALLTELTVEEKVAITVGKDFWATKDVPRLGIPSLKTSDGPNGARGEALRGGVKSACFPACVSLAASFDRELATQMGVYLGEEAKTKGASTLLGPTVCLHRDPRGGRNFESFSEDPYLTGELAGEYILGVQSQGVAATIKHYVANEQETCRLTMNVRTGQRALREIYLKSFEIAIKKSKPWALMTAFNLVNGVHVDSDKFLLDQVLRKEWGFDGVVMSDWGGTNSVADAYKAGHDLEMPGPAVQRTIENVIAALKSGELPMEKLDTCVLRNLEHLRRTGKFGNPGIADEQAIDRPEHRQFIRHAGAEGLVLLKNRDQALPLQPQKLKSIALIGLAKEYLGHGGGSPAVNSHHRVTPYQAIEEVIGKTVELKYSEGVWINRNLNPLSADVVDEQGKPGFTTRVYSGPGKDSLPDVLNRPDCSFQSIERDHLRSLTMTGTFTPNVSGFHYLSFSSMGNTALFINDELVFKSEGISKDVLAFLLSSAGEERKQYEFVAGKPYKVRVESSSISAAALNVPILANPLIGFQVGFCLQNSFEADLYTPAIENAKSSDLAIVFVGNTAPWETEGYDRKSMDLPVDGSQNHLIAGVAAANPNVIVVNSTGSPISMPWLDDVSAVVQAWFPGQEAGYAIADVLLGKVNPSGKLPVTFPRRAEDAPSYNHFPGDEEKLQVEYAEGIFVGYRHYDAHNPKAALFPFGFGLSYTTFAVTDVSLSSREMSKDNAVAVTTSIQNTGSLTGSEVVQVYVGPSDEPADTPKKILGGFAKVKDLKAGRSASVTSSIDMHSVARWDEEQYAWVVDAGKYRCYVGTSCEEAEQRAVEFEIKQGWNFGP